MRIRAQGNVGYLTGAKVTSDENSPKFETWATENERVKSWLIDSMEPSLINRYIRLPTAKDVWEAVEKTFYDDSDETRIFELNKKCFAARQNGQPLPTYYNELVGIFQEIDQRIASQNNTVAGVVQEMTAMACMRVHMFLSGLDSEYDQVSGEILGKDPKFSLEQSYSYVRKVHSDQQVMGHTFESSVMVVQRKQGPPPGFSNAPPDWWDFTRRPRKNQANATLTTTDEEKPSNASANVSQTGMIGKVSRNSSLIIDSGVSDHMVNDPNFLEKFKPSTQNIVSTADGTPTLVTREGSIVLSNTLTLDFVLVVPSLAYN
ncbi:hypothetical protein ACLB2K_028544 [Fragaria x ananassa]